MKANIRAILEDCIEIGIENGFGQAYKHVDNPAESQIRAAIEFGIWHEIDLRFDFETEERDLLAEVIEGFDSLETQRNKCNDHPDAPHGMDRSASHNAGRYVCECESWEPEKREWSNLTEEEMLDIVDTYGMQLASAIEDKLKGKNA